MAAKKLASGLIITEYLEKFPNLPSLTLAKIIYKDCPQAFSCVDTVRSTIRYYREKSGAVNANKLQDKRFADQNPYNLPESFSDEFFPFLIQGVKIVGILSDIHIPYHDLPALYCALEYFKKSNIDCLLLNGDIMDMYLLSVHEKDPRKRKIFEEIEDTRLFLTALRKEFPKVRIIYKMGNHEERYERYLITKAPELLGIQDFELKNILKFSELNIEAQTCDNQILKFNSLNIVHGHEIGRSFIPAVNPARGLFLRAKSSTICGHFHRTSEHSEKDINGKLTKCWSTGCLCDLTPRWLPVNNWGHGACIIRTEGEDFNVENFSIIHGRKV